MKKKAIIAADLAPRKIGSLEVTIFTVARMLKEVGFPTKTLFGGEITESVFRHSRLDDREVVTDLGRLSDRDARKRWLRRLSEEQPDILWLHFFPLHQVFIRQVRRACPNAWIVHSHRVSPLPGGEKSGFAKRWGRRLRSRLLTPSIDRFIAVSEFIAEHLNEVYHVPQERIDVAYNCVDLDRFRPAPPHAKRTYVSAVCNLQREKGVPILI